MKKRYVVWMIVLMLSFISNIKAKDLTQYFNIDDVKFCDDTNCTLVYDEENGCRATSNFLVKINWSFHSSIAINDSDTVVIPIATDLPTESSTYFETLGFSWADIYDDNNNKIGKWQISGNYTSRKVTIKFSDNAVGKMDLSGTLITPKNIHSMYTYHDRVVPLTVGNTAYSIRINTYNLPPQSSDTVFFMSRSSNNSVQLRSISPGITIKQLYNVNDYSSFTDRAVLSNLYYEFPIPSDLNATLAGCDLYARYLLPTDFINLDASGNGEFVNAQYLFIKVNQNENETYSSFKNRLNKFEYGIYEDINSKTLVVNFGEQPSNDITYSYLINNRYDFLQEPGDLTNYLNPFTLDSTNKNILNDLAGSTNRIGGRVSLWAVVLNFTFPTVKVETTKTFTSTWSWKNAAGEIKSDQKTTNATLVVPSSMASVSGTSQLLLRDVDSKNEIVGAKIKLQKKNGSYFEDVEELVTDSTGTVTFRNLESGIYRYVQTEYLPHYQTNSFKTYSDSELSNVVNIFEFDKNEGNIIYAVNEKEKFTVTYKKGTHGTFNDQVYSDIPYGSTTPYYEPSAEDGWIFKGWTPEREIFVIENKTYTALWNKLVTVTARYLEVGTNNELIPSIEDKKENGTAYTTERKDIINYEYVRVEGVESGTRGDNDITVTYYYKKKKSNLNIEYLDYTTNREIANSSNITLYYGDNYDSDIYESNVYIPQNYNRVAANKSENYKGIVDNDNINVKYYYNKKDSNLNASITMMGTNKITKSVDKVSYKIGYSIEYIDYIGSSTITLVDTLPYKIDVNNSNLDGGVYDDNNKTITWIVNTNINSYNENAYSLEKNIELKYKNINVIEDVIINNVSGTTEIDTKNTQVSTTYNTLIDIKGNIIVKYLENKTDNEILERITTTGKVGTKYEFVFENIEGYRLVKKPEKEKMEYKEEEQEFKYLYERIKYNIIVTSNEGGKVTGDEEVYYKEDSTIDNIKIEANDNYYIKSIFINDKKIDIPENQTELTISQFIKMTEDKNIEVIFEKVKTTVVVPNTLKKSKLVIFGFIVIIGSIISILYIMYKKNIIYNKY